MKDYYNGKYDKYILFYEENGDKIKVHFSNEVKEYENTEDMKKLLQQMMHRQVKLINFDDSIKVFNKSIKGNKIMMIGNLIVLIINLIAFIMFLNPLNLIALSINAGGFIYSMVLNIKDNTNVKDMTKTKLYLDNEDKLNDNCNINPELVAKLYNKECEYVASSEAIININSIEFLENEELEAIVQDINNNNYINHGYKKLTRKR